MKVYAKYLAGLLFLNSATCLCQTVSVHFEGTVYDETNAVIKGAMVLVTKDKAVFNYLKADESGNYNIYLPLNGEYDITVSKQGYVQKKYFVSTKNIPPEKSQVAFATNVADVVLYTWNEGIDYSLFNRPMNLYSYDPDKDNIDYDDDYLKEMKAAVKLFKKTEKETLKLAKEKARFAGEQLAIEKEKALKLRAEEKKAAEKMAYEKALADRLKEKENRQKSDIISDVSVQHYAGQTVMVSNTSIRKGQPDARLAELLNQYPPGVTEEIMQGPGVYIIQRVVVHHEMVWIYQKKIFSWGGVACFRDKQPISESTFEAETKKS